MMKTRLINFETFTAHKKYTICDENKIVGSDACKACYRYVGKIYENEKIGKAFTGRHMGIVECRCK